MLLIKRSILALMMLSGVALFAFPGNAMAARYSLDIMSDDLSSTLVDLNSFQIDIVYSDSDLDFGYWIVSDALDQIGVTDNSTGSDGSGTASISITLDSSYLLASNVTLLTLYFWGGTDAQSAVDAVYLSNVTVDGAQWTSASDSSNGAITIAPVPVPTSLGLLGISLLCLTKISRKEKN